jgi:hypothetical protein
MVMMMDPIAFVAVMTPVGFPLFGEMIPAFSQIDHRMGPGYPVPLIPEKIQTPAVQVELTQFFPQQGRIEA